MRYGRRWMLVLTVIATLLAACGGADEGDSAQETPADAGEPQAEPASETAGDDGAPQTEPASETAEEAAGGDGAWEPVYEDGVLQPLPSGFPDQPITIINVDDPGTRDGIYAREMKEILDDIAPVDILVTDEPEQTFGTFFKLNDIQSRPGATEGYHNIIVTIPGSVADFHVEPITEELGLTIEDFNPVIATETIPYVVSQRTDAPWGDTFMEMVDYARENPGELRYISNGVGSMNDIAMEWIMQEFDFEVQKIPASGNQEALSVIGAGEGDFTLSGADVALTNEQAGRVEVTLTTGSTVPAPWNENPNVVSADSVGLPPAPFGIVMGLIVRPEVPEEHMDWLHEMYRAAAETDSYREREARVPGLTVDVMSREETEAISQDLYEYSEEVVRAIGLHHEDN